VHEWYYQELEEEEEERFDFRKQKFIRDLLVL
jgi:hypothetical protein